MYANIKCNSNRNSYLICTRLLCPGSFRNWHTRICEAITRIRDVLEVLQEKLNQKEEIIRGF